MSFFRLLLFLVYTLSTFSQLSGQTSEVCDNAIDDDGDGLIDFNDEDCQCEFIELRTLIPNPSFEDKTCCPDQHYRLDCAPPWQQHLGHTPDYLNTCDYVGEDLNYARPIPDGDGFIGFADGHVWRGENEYDWKEYAQVKLKQEMEAGVSYRIEFSLGFLGSIDSPPLDISIFGTPNLNKLPFGVGSTSQLGCPTNHDEWYKLDSKYINGGQNPVWVDSFFEFTPDQNIAAIAIGPPCEPFDNEVTPYYLLDDLIMEETFLFQFKIRESGTYCHDDLTLQVNSPATLSYQWYKDRIALPGENNPKLKVRYGSGSYTVRMIEAGGCIMSPPYELHVEEPTVTKVKAVLCKGDTYKDHSFSSSMPGIFEYSLKNKEGCDSLIHLELTDCIFDLPNAFRPREEGPNQYLEVQGNLGDIDVLLQVYDRWGNRVYSGRRWNGYIEDRPAPSGMYIVVMSITNETYQGSPRYKAVYLID